MARRGDVPTRSEVTEKVETNKRELEAKETDLDKIAQDDEIVKDTLEQIQFDGTAEGSNEVKSAIESAKDVTKEVFDKENDSLEQIQADNQELEGELQERCESSQLDLGKISDATAKIETKETINELARAKEAISHDTDFLKEQRVRASEARKESDDIQRRLQARVHTG